MGSRPPPRRPPCSVLASVQPVFPISFSTLGCPKWPWARILEQASALGYAAVELRGIEGEMDLTKRPEFIGTRVDQSVKDLSALNIKISDLGASSRMHEADPKVRAAQLDEGKRFIDLAHTLNSPYVRVFGDRVPAGETRQAVTARVIDGLRTLGDHAKGSGVAVIIESHGDFTDSASLAEILKGAAMPNVALLWDAHHTCVASKEDPAATYKALGSYVRHTHLKDSRPDGTGVKYVLTGTRHGPGTRDGRCPGEGRLPRLLRLRVGKGVAPRNRGTGNRVSTLRGAHAPAPRRGRGNAKIGR